MRMEKGEQLKNNTAGHCTTITQISRTSSWQGKVGWVTPNPINHMHKVFPHQITFCTRLMFYLVRVGKEWTGPVFPYPLKSKGYIWIHDRVWLAVFLGKQLTICTTVFPHRITFCTRLMWGAEWLSGRVSVSGARGRGFDTYRRRVVSLSKTLYSPNVLVNYPGSGGSVPTWLKNCWLGR